jgi:hypothetical protein
VDNQCQNGQWSYGEPSPFTAGTPTTGNKVAVASAARDFAPGEKQKPKVVHKITVEKKREGPPAGDNSNSQYAALGLRACHDAGIMLPKETVIKPAKKWWTTSQLGDKGGKDNAVATAGGQMLADPRGWSYSTADPAYSSMTTGAIGAVCIFDYILGEDWKKDKVVAGGMGLLIKNCSVTENVGPCETGGKAQGVPLLLPLCPERAGMLLTPPSSATTTVPDGARVIRRAEARRSGGAVRPRCARGRPASPSVPQAGDPPLAVSVDPGSVAPRGPRATVGS